MDVNSAFLYGTIKQKVYVTQPPRFKDPDHLEKVYKVVKVLYGLHQAPRAWYKTLASYLLGNGFKRGKIDQTLFIKKQKGDIFLVQVYVDDIIFGSTNKELCTGFEKLMKEKFQMSSMGELTFFLGLQVQQKEDEIFISQDKYIAMILKKFNYTDVKSASTPVDLEKPLVKDGDANDVDVHLYRSMIRYLKGKPTLGLWYSKDSPFELVAYTDSDYAGATQDMKSITRVATSTTEAEYVAAASCCGQACQKRSDTKIPQSSGPPINVGNEAVHKELGDRMEKAATTASSLEAEQESGSCPRCQDIILGDVDAQTRFDTTSKQSYDPPLLRGYTLRSREDSLKLLELIELCTTLWATARAKTVNGVRQIQALIDKNKLIITETSIRSDLARMGEGKDFSGRITPLFETMMVQPTQDEGVDSGIPADSLQTPIPTQPSSSRSQKKQSKRKQRKDTAVTQEEPQQDDSVPTPSNDPPLSGEDSMQLSELMLLCTNLQKQVLDLEKAKDAQAKEIADLKKRVQRLERKKKSRTTGLKRLKKVGMSRRVESYEDQESLVDDTQGRSDDADMFDINDLHGDEVNVDMPVSENQEQSVKEREVDTSVEGSAAPTTIEEITLAQTLIQIKVAKPKVVTTAATTTTTTRPKARGVVVHEPIALDKDLARNLQAQLEDELIEEEKLARKQEEEANIALIESWDNTQAMMEVDFELAQRLQTEEQGEITIEERFRTAVVVLYEQKKETF
ncbi:putative ribonuclease H-like domain-containing protein [Tanacetum coccineum]